MWDIPIDRSHGHNVSVEMVACVSGHTGGSVILIVGDKNYEKKQKTV